MTVRAARSIRRQSDCFIHRQATSSASSATWRHATWSARLSPPSGRANLSHPKGAALPELVPRVRDSDHASFWHEGYPALMVTDTANFRYPYYHTPEDTIDKIDFDRMARVVRGLEKVVAELVSTEYGREPYRRSNPDGLPFAVAGLAAASTTM